MNKIMNSRPMIPIRLIWLFIQIVFVLLCLVTVVPLWAGLRHIIPNALSDLWDKTRGGKVFKNTGGGYRDVIYDETTARGAK